MPCCTLQVALEELGYPCYHMSEVFRNKGHAKLWLQVAKGNESVCTRILLEGEGNYNHMLSHVIGHIVHNTLPHFHSVLLNICHVDVSPGCEPEALMCIVINACDLIGLMISEYFQSQKRTVKLDYVIVQVVV